MTIDPVCPSPASALRRARSVLAHSLSAWIDHRAGSKGAAIAFYMLFAITPILMLAIAGAGFFFGADAARGEIMAQLEDILGKSGAATVQDLVAHTADPASGLLATVLASVLLLVAAASVFVEIKASIDELWGVAPRTGSAVVAFLRTQLHSFGLVLVLGLLLVSSLAVSAVLALVQGYANGLLRGSSHIVALGSSACSLAVIACLFAVIYKTLPDRTLSWSDVWIGAGFTTGLFGLGKYAIGLYLASSIVASGFGAAGSLIALLLWLYYSAQIFLLGAELTRQYALEFGSLRGQ